MAAAKSSTILMHEWFIPWLTYDGMNTIINNAAGGQQTPPLVGRIPDTYYCSMQITSQIALVLATS